MINPEKIAHDLSLIYVKHHLDELRQMNYHFSENLPVPKEIEELEIMWQTYAYAFQYLSASLSEETFERIWKEFDEGKLPKLF